MSRWLWGLLFFVSFEQPTIQKMYLLTGKQEDAIKLRTRRDERIANNHFTDDLSVHDMKTILDMRQKFPLAKLRSGPCGYYNCLGLVFASRRARIFENEDIENILKHDNYRKVAEKHVMAGDVIIYKENGFFVHCGIVIQKENLSFTIVSKWGNGDELIHPHQYCFYWNANTTLEFYRVFPERMYDFDSIYKINHNLTL